MVSTPYMDEAERCSRVGFIMNGILMREGTPGEFPASYPYEILSARAPDIVRRTRGLVFPPSIRNVRTFGDRLHLSVENAEADVSGIRAFFSETGFVDVEVESVSPSMRTGRRDMMRHAGTTTAPGAQPMTGDHAIDVRELARNSVPHRGGPRIVHGGPSEVFGFSERLERENPPQPLLTGNPPVGGGGTVADTTSSAGRGRSPEYRVHVPEVQPLRRPHVEENLSFLRGVTVRSGKTATSGRERLYDSLGLGGTDTA